MAQLHFQFFFFCFLFSFYLNCLCAFFSMKLENNSAKQNQRKNYKTTLFLLGRFFFLFPSPIWRKLLIHKSRPKFRFCTVRRIFSLSCFQFCLLAFSYNYFYLARELRNSFEAHFWRAPKVRGEEAGYTEGRKQKEDAVGKVSLLTFSSTLQNLSFAALFCSTHSTSLPFYLSHILNFLVVVFKLKQGEREIGALLVLALLSF